MNIYSCPVTNISCYEIYTNKKIGSGKYSQVYMGKCTDAEKIKKYNINGTVAIKKIKTEPLSFKTKKLVQSEVEIMNKIKENPHDNIIKCIDVVEMIDYVYIVMEYCENDMAKLIKHPLSERNAKFYFYQIVNALSYLHKNNIMHRDLKPRNILISNRQVKICDFGFAKNSTGKFSTKCGSPLYMAPEILNNLSYCDSIDVWSAGIILYELLFGVNPFSNCQNIDEVKEYMKNSKIEIPPKKLKIRYKLSHDCITLLESLLQVDNNKRIKFVDLYKHKWFDSFDYKEYIKYIDADRYDSDEYNDFDDCDNDYSLNELNKNDNSDCDYDFESHDVFKLDD